MLRQPYAWERARTVVRGGSSMRTQSCHLSRLHNQWQLCEPVGQRFRISDPLLSLPSTPSHLFCSEAYSPTTECAAGGASSYGHTFDPTGDWEHFRRIPGQSGHPRNLVTRKMGADTSYGVFRHPVSSLGCSRPTSYLLWSPIPSSSPISGDRRNQVNLSVNK